MTKSTLTISSRNYSSWSMRGWLLCAMAGLDFDVEVLSADDPSTRAELLLLSPSFLVPCLVHERVRVWDTLAIAEYVAEARPAAGLLPTERAARAHCRAISGEMHSGFFNMRSALPMNLKAHHPGYKVYPGARADIDRVEQIWSECLETYGGPYLFGTLTMADAMFAPVCTRLRTYDVRVSPDCEAYCDTILAWPLVKSWTQAAREEPDDVDELDVEF